MKETILRLRDAMSRAGVFAYLVPTADFHGSEYVGSYFKGRTYLSGFTGSAGTLLVTPEFAGLWTDGRYFIQAEKQLKDSGITLCKMGEPGVPTILEYLKEHAAPGAVLGFDARCVSAAEYDAYRACMEGAGGSVCGTLDLVDEVWDNRPALSAEPVWELPVTYAGKTRAQKLLDLRDALAQKKADWHLLTVLDDIAWLLNLRGNDVACSPVFLSYLACSASEVLLFVNASILSGELVKALEADGVLIRPYEEFYAFVSSLEGQRVLFNRQKVNAAVLEALPDSAVLVEGENPTEWAKSVKNETEQQMMIEAHRRDGAALTKWIYWLKQAVKTESLTEISAAERLETFREAQPDYQGPSFAPILSYAEHGAIVHYSATPETNADLAPHGFLLADTGGHYLQGTTDVTRTIALGALTEEEKHFYTAVLRGHLNLGAAQFRYGCTGLSLDILARQPLWEAGLDYNHGTGHGVGYLLNVHEGPNAFRWRVSPGRREDTVFEDGMITSNEPGFYLEGKFGIRIENLVLCKESLVNEYGKFMHFVPLTLCPYEREAILPEELSDRECALLDAYHQTVYDTLSPMMNDEERAWLFAVTRPIREK